MIEQVLVKIVKWFIRKFLKKHHLKKKPVKRLFVQTEDTRGRSQII